MGDRLNQADSVLFRLQQELPSLEAKYGQCLSAQQIPDGLKIDIKRFLGDLRSVLDYLAHEIRERFCPATTHSDKLLFPMWDSLPAFTSRINRSFPGLSTSQPDLVAYLESKQPYHDSMNWLHVMNHINNGNKHVELTPQKRHERRETQIVSADGGTRIHLNPDAVKFGPGARVAIDPKSKVTHTTWIDFQTPDDVSMLGLIKESLDGIVAINAELRTRLT